MGRPCYCDRLPPEGQPYTTDYCRLCWLWHYDASYRCFWEADKGTGVQIPKKELHCPHLQRRIRDAEGKVKKQWCEAG